MNESAADNFGILISYLIPGATVLWGLSFFSPVLRSWFAVSPPDAPTIGGFLFLTVAALAAGMIVSALRWAILDTIHAHTGLPLPRLDFSRLGSNVEAFTLLIEIHYRHFLFYSNAFIATAIAYVCYRFHASLTGPWGAIDLGFVAVEIVLFATSRDTLRRYYTRSEQLLGGTEQDQSRGVVLTSAATMRSGRGR